MHPVEATQFEALWESSDSPPDVFEFLDRHHDSDASARLAVLLLDQRRRWKTNQPLAVEDYLCRVPDLASHREFKLELVLGEFFARKERDPSTSIDEFESRFADLHDLLRRRIGRRQVAEDVTIVAEALGTFSIDSRDADPCETLESDASRPGPCIGRYRSDRLLGEGGYGRVYLAFDRELYRQVAVKVPTAKRFRSPKDAELYLAEARVVAGLDHPNIVPVYDVGHTEDGAIYVVSKFIEGCTLTDRIKAGRLSHGEAARLLASVAQGLQHAHQRRIIHRDIKPGNILLEESTGRAYLADFGLAIHEEDYLRDAKVAGTPDYMSPEQARGEGHRLDARSDIYSLGVVLYELLTGKRPFRGSTKNEVLYQTVTNDPERPRAVDDSIAPELERICLKAIAKRASDRYHTAAEFADDLLSWQQGPQVPTDGLRIVPKGLRSFDADDAEFFLELLPGPRSRDGLPESIRFWKKRIEESDPDKTFSVGLIYGPSGCGKSSMVKAGLLPRLSEDVAAIYLEATPNETETRILRGLRKHLKELPDELSLVETFAWLRRNESRRVVVILDQFEQWLHAHRAEQDTDLVRALRQCDGGRLQAVVMVRDDFSMAASRFMRELETRILEGHNFATVDLFDIDHAANVLTKFGQAFGKLPQDLSRITDPQRKFIESVASGLAEDGKVVSVRLALLAEMVKGKPWIPETLDEVGGTEGIGANFLEEMFGNRDANPEHRLHQTAARRVLMKLLPDVGSDIKGNMRSHLELLEVSGYDERSGEFNDLLRILDGKLRLITPTDPEGSQTEPASDRHAQFYQLTHDYLVPSLRKWLTRKQRETRRGRAELLLTERSTLWNSKPQQRYLPSWWEWASIQTLTDRRDWTEPQRGMMRKARQLHSGRFTAMILLLGLAAATGFSWRRSSREAANDNQATAFVSELASAKIEQVPEIIERSEPYKKWVIPKLTQALEQHDRESSARLNLSLALLKYDPLQLSYLEQRLLMADADQVPTILELLREHAGELIPNLWSIATQLKSDQPDPLLRAASALAAYDSNNDAQWSHVSDKLVDALVKENVLRLAVWIKTLRPTRQHFIGPLANVYRNESSSYSQNEVDRATGILEDYAADDSDALADLLFDADPDQFTALFDEFAAHGSAARNHVDRELSQTIKPQWQDSPGDSQWKDLPSDVILAIEQSGGMVAERFAFCQTMPLSGFRETIERMRSSGFLPIRIRPYQSDADVLVAAAWRQDDRDWRYSLDRSADEIYAEDKRQRSDGYTAVDVAGYIEESETGRQERFAAVWMERVEGDEEAEIFVGCEHDDVREIYEALDRSGHRFTDALQVIRGLGGQRKFSGVVSDRADTSTVRFNRSSTDLESIRYLHEIIWDLDPSRARARPTPGFRNRQTLAVAMRRASDANADDDARLALAIAQFHSGNNRQAISQLDGLITRLESSSSVATQGGAERRILDEAYRYRALSHARAGDSAAANAALNELMQRKIDASVKACTEAMVLSYLESAFDASQLESLAESPSADATSLLNIASAYSMASEIIREENVTLSKLYADRAVSLIRDALKAGLSDIERLETDPFLDPLQELPEFNELLESDGRGVRYAAVWNNSGWAESVSLSGLDPESHREKCRELMRDGYRVGSIGATQIGNDIVTASVWLRPLISTSERERLARRQANATAAAIRMGEAEQSWPLLTTSPDPRLQSWIIHRLATTGVSPDVILERLRQEADPSVAQALILSLGNFDVASLDNRSAMTSMLLGRYRSDPDAGIRSAALWTLQRWGFKDELESIDRELAGRTPRENSDWYVSKSGQTMVVIRGPVESLMGSPYTEPDRSSFEHLHKKRISRSFAISSKEITVAQFAEFLRDYPRLSYPFSRKQAGEADCPQISVTWYEAAMYCRWLSEREEIAEDQMCYPEIEEIKPGMSLPDDYLSRHGYRLPTEAEWEYACRAGTITSRYYGDTDDLLDQYAWYLQNSDYRTWPVASLKPNRFGLFDMLGNVQEWCQESVSNYSDSLGQVSEDQPVSDVINDADRRLLRGGGFGIPSADIRSAYRGRNRPSARYNNTGFRVVRTHPER